MKYLLNKKPVYLELFGNREQVLNEFDIKLDDDIKILFAFYGIEEYEGNAYVLCYSDGELFEVYGSHCSCYGLEYQWHPESTTLEEIKFRLSKGSIYEEFKKQLIEFIIE